jgi:hypothetical protein
MDEVVKTAEETQSLDAGLTGQRPEAKPQGEAPDKSKENIAKLHSTYQAKESILKVQVVEAEKRRDEAITESEEIRGLLKTTRDAANISDDEGGRLDYVSKLEADLVARGKRQSERELTYMRSTVALENGIPMQDLMGFTDVRDIENYALRAKITKLETPSEDTESTDTSNDGGTPPKPKIDRSGAGSPGAASAGPPPNLKGRELTEWAHAHGGLDKERP